MAQRNAQSFDAMRQDAIRRSREMHRRANLTPPSPPPPVPPPPPQEQRPPTTQQLSGLLEGLHLSEELHGLLTEWDGEKLALAGMLYLLWKEGADPALLLAIAYILL